MIKSSFSSLKMQILAFVVLVLIGALFLWVSLHFAASVTSGLLTPKPPT
jgi:membrane glycosyltransferase